MNKTKLLSCLAHYFYGLVASSANAGVTAVVAFFGLAGVAAAGATVAPLSLHQGFAVFGSAVVGHALIYFSAHPLPDDFPDDPPDSEIPPQQGGVAPATPKS